MLKLRLRLRLGLGVRTRKAYMYLCDESSDTLINIFSIGEHSLDEDLTVHGLPSIFLNLFRGECSIRIQHYAFQDLIHLRFKISRSDLGSRLGLGLLFNRICACSSESDISVPQY